MSVNEAIRTESLTKVYPGGIVGVDHASFAVNRGEIFGYLGLNGAGKSTTIKMLTTLISPTSGSAHIFGYSIAKQGLQIRRRIGVVQQQESYDRNLKVEASLKLYASLWGIESEEAERRINFLAEKFDLKDTLKRKIRWLSYGQRRRLQVAREFLHDAELLILDEPTVGMDVLARHAFLEYCKELAKNGTTIFFTTHVVSEAEYLCDRVAVIHRGKIIALDTPRELKKKYTDIRGVSVVLKNRADAERLFADLNPSRVAKKSFVSDSSEIRVSSDEPFQVVNDISRLILSRGYDVETVSVTEPSLEDVIVRLVEEESKGN
ncbi:MAG: ABC transporter ATP-binding protein [Nitrososphaerota archaeon]|nr:ABC transporter ATP-binding protein [Nitrososphaerota archaeon]